MLYELEMLLREQGSSSFVYDEEKVLFRFKDEAGLHSPALRLM